MPTQQTLLLVSESTRLALKPLLSARADIAVVAHAVSVSGARVILEMLKVDVVMIEASLPDEDGFAVLAAVPADTHVIVLTRDAAEMMRAVACGLDFVSLPLAPAALADAFAAMPAPRAFARLGAA